MGLNQGKLRTDYGSFLTSMADANVVTIASENPSLKTEVLVSACNYWIAAGTQVQYIDIDLQFSSYLKNYHTIRGFGIRLTDELLQISTPELEDIGRHILQFLITSELRRGGVIIIDSINSLQNAIRVGSSEIDSVTANHKVAILITMIQILARSYSKSVWITNIARNRPASSDGSAQWEKSLSGGRMMQVKTDATATLELRLNKDSPKLSTIVARTSKRGSNGQVIYELGLDQ